MVAPGHKRRGLSISLTLQTHDAGGILPLTVRTVSVVRTEVATYLKSTYVYGVRQVSYKQVEERASDVGYLLQTLRGISPEPCGCEDHRLLHYADVYAGYERRFAFSIKWWI